MTQFAPSEDVLCPVCGAVNQPSRLMSTHSFGSPDLDLRPAPDEGRLLEYMIESCQACGYSASSLDNPVPVEAREAMASVEWKELGSRTDLPPLAIAYLRAALIYRWSRQLTSAVWASLRGVWVCDDEQNQAADDLRRSTASLVDQAANQGMPFIEQPGGSEALLADLLRRSGDRESALSWVEKGSRIAAEPVIVAILAYQKHLLEAGDGALHRIEEAFARPSTPGR